MDTESSTIKLNDQELDLARRVAMARYSSARAGGVRNAKIGGQSNFETDFGGFCGELAFARLHNVYPDLSITAGGAGYDCVVGGVRVDVKTTKYASGVLLSRADKDYPEVDVYALMVGDPITGEYRYAGWARSDELRKPENVDSEKFRGSYVLPQSALHTDPISI